MSIGMQAHVGKGTVAHRGGLSFGGFAILPEGDGEPAQVVITVWDPRSSERDFKLAVGESLEFAGQKWRLDEIDDTAHRWYATLTRVA
jgi:hypothetical protein